MAGVTPCGLPQGRPKMTSHIQGAICDHSPHAAIRPPVAAVAWQLTAGQSVSRRYFQSCACRHLALSVAPRPDQLGLCTPKHGKPGTKTERIQQDISNSHSCDLAEWEGSTGRKSLVTWRCSLSDRLRYQVNNLPGVNNVRFCTERNHGWSPVCKSQLHTLPRRTLPACHQHKLQKD